MLQNQNNYRSDQSQRTQTIQLTNQNSKQMQVAGMKRGKMCERVTIGFGVISDWFRKWRGVVFENNHFASESKRQ